MNATFCYGMSRIQSSRAKAAREATPEILTGPCLRPRPIGAPSYSLRWLLFGATGGSGSHRSPGGFPGNRAEAAAGRTGGSSGPLRWLPWYGPSGPEKLLERCLGATGAPHDPPRLTLDPSESRRSASDFPGFQRLQKAAHRSAQESQSLELKQARTNTTSVRPFVRQWTIA
jgi:hypothetical protein